LKVPVESLIDKNNKNNKNNKNDYRFKYGFACFVKNKQN
jgi:hypothetical protein